MREDWKIMRLGDVASYINGFAFKPEDWSDKGLPIIRIQNLTENNRSFHYCQRKDIQSKYLVHKGDILISWSATLGVFEWVLDDALLNQHIFKVVFDKTEINKQFFKYAIHMSIDEMSRHTNGATMRHIRKGDFDNICIPVPPLSEQDRIVALLDDQFEKIDTLKANAASQLQAAKDLFQSVLKEMLTPKEGWEEKELKDICTSIKDGDWIERKDQSISGIRLLQTGNIGVGIYKDKSDSPHYISLDTFNRLHCEEVFEGDILLSRLPEPVGRACLVPKMEGRFITAVDCSIIKLNTDKISPEYFIFYTQTNAYFKNISFLCTGTTRQRISRKKLEEVIISFPSLPEQERIAARLDAISEKVKALQTNYDQIINLCNDLKQALLKSIFA